eukprot:TRINITY_DN28371_c0_g1_i2.p1 TRINITY_DN28371_c0_g1~~TRINITY_DN28371_c0_g1_i2.p1  ORF type:complete len:628 (+),score=106.36 TRINITY_DN28371_c0_g1_i2:22-1884(+)
MRLSHSILLEKLPSCCLKTAMMLRCLTATLVLAAVSADPQIRGGNKTRFMDVQYLDEKDVDMTMALEMSAEANGTRLAMLEEALRPTYQSLPKDAYGHLGHQTVRYILHRYFLNIRGWLIKGLEPQGWVPSYLQQRFEEQATQKRGTQLHDLAEMAAAIEDLVRKEARGQLKQVYESLGLDVSQTLTPEDAQQVIDMYMLVLLTARNVTLGDPTRNRKRLGVFKKKYTGFNEMHHWLEELERPYLSGAPTAFNAVNRVAEAIGEQYPAFNDNECLDLKRTLMKMEGGSRKAGRIPLVDFYNNTRFSHWKFTESPEYLRDLGALDESDPRRPYVILANYVSSFNNCIRSSNLYAMCCRSPCELLMASLERDVAAPNATPEQLAELVGNLSTDTVAARGQLEQKLLERLQSVARKSGGRVPLHGRLFAQWMHHAFPRECPYPHEAGVTNPQTPDEWMQATGRTTSVSEDQIQKIVRDTCPSEALMPGIQETSQALSPCGSEDAELPWTDGEELLETATRRRLHEEEEPAPPYHFLLGLSLPAILASAYAIDQKFASKGPQQQRKARLLMGTVFLAGLGVALDLLNPRCVMGAGLLFFLWRRFSAPCMPGTLPITNKCAECDV